MFAFSSTMFISSFLERKLEADRAAAEMQRRLLGDTDGNDQTQGSRTSKARSGTSKSTKIKRISPEDEEKARLLALRYFKCY